MRRSLAAALVLLGLAAAPAAAAPVDDALAALRFTPLGGAAAPALVLERLADGKKVGLAELRGRPVIIYFWATW